MKWQPDLNTSVFEKTNFKLNLPEKNFSKVVWVLRQGPESSVDELALFCSTGMANNNSIIPAPLFHVLANYVLCSNPFNEHFVRGKTKSFNSLQDDSRKIKIFLESS